MRSVVSLRRRSQQPHGEEACNQAHAYHPRPGSLRRRRTDHGVGEWKGGVEGIGERKNRKGEEEGRGTLADGRRTPSPISVAVSYFRFWRRTPQKRDKFGVLAFQKR